MLSEIVFNVKNNEKLDQKLKSIFRIINEKNFSEAAIIFSLSDTSNNGGKLGWIKEEILSKKIRDEIRVRKIGEITKPITIPGGFLILFIEDIKNNEIQLDLKKELANIIEKKTNAQLNQLSNVYFNKLKKNVLINEL